MFLLYHIMDSSFILDKFNNMDKKKKDFFFYLLDNIDHINLEKISKKIIVFPPTIPIDTLNKSSPIYIVFLKFLNGILNNINKCSISDITDFKNIDRSDIIADNNILLLNNMSYELFLHFDENKIGYHRKTPQIVLNCLRCMCKFLGFSFNSNKITLKRDTGLFETHYLYSILPL